MRRQFLLVPVAVALGLSGACGSSSATSGTGGKAGGGASGSVAGSGGGSGGGMAGAGGGLAGAAGSVAGHDGASGGAAGNAAGRGGSNASGNTAGASGSSAGAGGSNGNAGAGGSNGNAGAGGSNGNAGAGGSLTGIVLTPNSTGFVTNPGAGVVGRWFAFGDGVGPDGMAADSDCVMTGGFAPSQCSQINRPIPGQSFPPEAGTGAMCTNGTAAKVVPVAGGAAPAYTDLWGAGIGVYFNNPVGNASTQGTFDLSPYTGLSFEFSGANIPADHIRVIFPFVGQGSGNDSLGDPPYWAASLTDNQSTILGGASPATNVVRWADVLGPAYLMSQIPPTVPAPFDRSMAYGIGFQVITNTTTTTPYAFCVNNLTLLTN